MSKYKLHTLYITGDSNNKYYLYFTNVNETTHKYIKDVTYTYSGYYILASILSDTSACLSMNESTETHINSLEVSEVYYQHEIFRFKALVRQELDKISDKIKENIKKELKSLREVMVILGSV